jgi:hypothetical protein
VERHSLDATSLLFGAVFTVVGLLLIAGVGIQIVVGSWVAPTAAILIGIALLLAAPRPTRAPAESPGDEGQAA